MKKSVSVGAVAICMAAAVLLVAVPTAQRGSPVAGKVIDLSTERPVAGASVEYEDDSGKEIETTRTGADGGFEFSAASAGTKGVVTVTAKGYSPAHRRWPPLRGFGTLEVTLQPPASVSGTVADMASGSRLAATVHIMVEHEHSFVSDSTSTDSRGEFAFSDLPTGPAAVVAVADGYAPSFQTLRVRHEAHTTARIRLLLQGHVYGNVVDGNGKGVLGAVVSAWYGADPPDGAETLESYIGGRMQTGPEGQFRVDGIVPDRSVVLQAELDGKESKPITVKVGPGMVQESVVLRIE